jgi:hypothetical protein
MSQPAGIEAIDKEIAALEQSAEIKARIAELKEARKFLVEWYRSANASATTALPKETIAPKVPNSEPVSEKRSRAKKEPGAESQTARVLHFVQNHGPVGIDDIKTYLDDLDSRQITFALQALKRAGRTVRRSDGLWDAVSQSGVVTLKDIDQDPDTEQSFPAHDEAEEAA